MKITEKQKTYYPLVLAEALVVLPKLEAKVAGKELDKNGCNSAALGGTHREIGMLEYLLNGNIASFRKHLTESAKLRISRFHRFHSGEPIDYSFVTMLAYQDIYDALAAGAFDLAVELAGLMGEAPRLEEKLISKIHPFDRVMAKALKSMVLGRDTIVAIAELNEYFQKKRKKNYKNFFAYSAAFEAIRLKEPAMFDMGMRELLKGHEAESKRGIFRDMWDCHLSIWGLGVANLAVQHGIEVSINDDLLPAELIVSKS